MALTLPEATVRGLKRIDKDIAWAIVHMLEQDGAPPRRRSAGQPDVELVKIGEGRSLIAVNQTIVRWLPGVHIIPLEDTRAFLALEPGKGMADLELAIADRLEQRVSARERDVLGRMRALLRAWRRNRALQFTARTIIEVERRGRGVRTGNR